MVAATAIEIFWNTLFPLLLIRRERVLHQMQNTMYLGMMTFRDLLSLSRLNNTLARERINDWFRLEFDD